MESAVSFIKHGDAFLFSMKILLLLLATATVARAAGFFGEARISAGYSTNEPALLTATSKLTLDGPGTYTAESWDIRGNLRFARGGQYRLISTRGSIVFGPTSVVHAPDENDGLVETGLTVVAAGGFVAEGIVYMAFTQDVPPARPETPLVNISTRSTLAAGQTLSSGFSVGGAVSRRVLIRAVGPTLTNFGVGNPLAAPTLTVFSGQTTVGSNAGWGGDAALTAVFSAVGAFTLPSGSRDAAIVLRLNPGSYTVQVGGGAGEVLVEVYFVD